ncbi:DUF402 domain-containing protein [Mycoplasma parvum]|uniref:DUF402 domain-containing protein n=1 Tax=Mycoplasma parvum str. Indiana TaxID=1403316 RepID=U5NFK9_9MOLU|nr:DUF402 domain-containing protein [Mycoplasma parvum]AGX89018.1 hypothetical protein PRV_01280 [Mycoplasma parvum str. Indiana]
MIHSYKLDGTLTKSIENHYLIYENASLWIFFLPPFQTEFLNEIEIDIPSTKNKGVNFKTKKYTSSTNKFPIFWFFWKDHWFNILLTLQPKDKYSIYLNIATPPLIEEKAFKYIDFELDMRLNSKQELNFLNSEIYEAQALKFKYSNNLKKELSKNMRRIFVLLKNKWFQKLVTNEMISFLWEQTTSIVGKNKEDILKKSNLTDFNERLEISEFN